MFSSATVATTRGVITSYALMLFRRIRFCIILFSFSPKTPSSVPIVASAEISSILVECSEALLENNLVINDEAITNG